MFFLHALVISQISLHGLDLGTSLPPFELSPSDQQLLVFFTVVNVGSAKPIIWKVQGSIIAARMYRLQVRNWTGIILGKQHDVLNGMLIMVCDQQDRPLSS